MNLRRGLLVALATACLAQGSLRADDNAGDKSSLKFRPPGAKHTDTGKSRITLGGAQAKKPAQSEAKPLHSGGGVITAAYTQGQDRYADRYSSDRSASGDTSASDDRISGDDFFGGSSQQPEFVPPPPRMFATQDQGGQDAGGIVPPPAQPQPGTRPAQDPLAHCRTKEEMSIRSLVDIDLNHTNVTGDIPVDCSLFYEEFSGRNWGWVDFYWKASAICHKPLYFEDVPLERYGHTHGMFVQPFISGAHFFATIPMLPYKMGVHHPTECLYPLGYYRPGSCAPKLMYPLPLSARGVLYQGAASTGLVFLLP